MSRILFFSQVLPYPPDAGPKVRSYYTLRHLARHHQVTLVAFVRPDDSPQAIAHLRSFCAEVHTVPILRSKLNDVKELTASLLTHQSFIIRRDFIPEMARCVETLTANTNFDFIHADQLWMARYALQAARRLPAAKLILDEHNACFQIIQRLSKSEPNLAKRLVLMNEWRVLKRYEAWALKQFHQVVTVTDEDRAILENLSAVRERGPRQTCFTTIPICVDTQSTQPVTPQKATHNVLHLGTMFWLPNIEGVLWFEREVWSQVIAQVPDATFTIVGKNPPEAVKNLVQGCHNGQGASPCRIQVTGYVADPADYLSQAGAFIVPLHAGSGMRVKIVDGWRWGLPVISTRIGAEGIRYRDGENILIADTPADFAQAVIQTLTDPDLQQRLRVNGRRWVETNYDWQHVYPQWDEVYGF